jgi:hypothetical protein
MCTPEIAEYTPGFLYCVDGIAENLFEIFSYEKIRKSTFPCKYILILYGNRDIESQDIAYSQAVRI